MIIEGEEQIALHRMITLHSALKLELFGMKRRGQSAYSIIKQEYNLKGSKQKVYDTFDALIKIKKDEVRQNG